MLVQHQYNPGMHMMETYDNSLLYVSSTHHQAAYPFRMNKNDYKILGWSNKISPMHEGGNKEELNPEKECEIVYYPKTSCLGIQLHPEMLQYTHRTNVWLRNLLTKFLNNDI